MRGKMFALPSDIDFTGIDPRTTFIVGGSVRDLLLGRAPLDIDIATAADPRAFAQQLAERLSGSWVEIGKSELTIHRVVDGSRIFDVSALHGGEIEEDLRRRDFTVNAMAADAATGEIIDCTGGGKDLEAARIRMVSPAVFAADPVRLIRAYRLAAGLQFVIEPATRKAIADNARRIGRSAGERIRDELLKILRFSTSLDYLQLMHEDGLLTAIFPELAALQHCRQGGHHRWDVFTHSLQAYRQLESMLSAPGAWLPAEVQPQLWSPDDIPAATLKLAILLHDVGKPQSRQVDKQGNVHFYGHGKKSADIAARITRRLKMSRRDAGYIDFIIRSHIRPLHLFTAQGSGRVTDRAKTRFFTRCGRHTPDLLLHCMADIEAKGTGEQRNRQFVDFARHLLKEYLAAYLPRSSRRPLLNGRDLMGALGLSPSPLLGRLLRQIEEARLAGDLRTRAEALTLAEKLIAADRRKSQSGR
jgi:tRNA nucleotidyltransferase/poly(A) polymerase